jgi:hypothetical protein
MGDHLESTVPRCRVSVLIHRIDAQYLVGWGRRGNERETEIEIEKGR